MGVGWRGTGVLIQDLVAHGNTFIANIDWGLAFGAANEFFYFVDRLAAERTTADKSIFHIIPHECLDSKIVMPRLEVNAARLRFYLCL